MRSGPAFYSVRADGLTVAVRLTPKARRVGVFGVASDAEGVGVLKIGVSAAPENGKANAALIDLLSKSWGIPKRDLHIVQGETDRRKVVLIGGDAKEILDRLTPVFEALRPV